MGSEYRLPCSCNLQFFNIVKVNPSRKHQAVKMNEQFMRASIAIRVKKYIHNSYADLTLSIEGMSLDLGVSKPTYVLYLKKK